MGGLKWLAVAGAAGAHLHDPAGAAPCLADVLWSLFCPQCPGDVSAVADFVIRCHKRDVALSLELAADLTMQSLLVRFHRQEEVGPLFPELSKNGCWVCNVDVTPLKKRLFTAKARPMHRCQGADHQNLALYCSATIRETLEKFDFRDSTN